MSLPKEQINAQRRIWTWFAHDVLPRSKWPRHFMSATELEIVYEDALKWRAHQAAKTQADPVPPTPEPAP